MTWWIYLIIAVAAFLITLAILIWDALKGESSA